MNFKRILILVKKEAKDAFLSPLLYVLTGLFVLIIGWLFFNYLVQSKTLSTVSMSQAVLIPIYGNINFMFVFLAPLLTMGAFSEEKKQLTLDLLLVSKLTRQEIIIGKWISHILKALFMLLFTFLFPIILAISGYSDWGLIFSTYLGVVLSVMAYLTVGIFCSSLTDNLIIASLLTFSMLLGSMLLVISTNATNNVLLGQMIQYLAIPFHYEGFISGLIRSYSIVYFISFLLFFFFLTNKSLERRKW